MDLQLHDKRALVTGASKGIGESCASALAKEGCDLVLVARHADALDSVARSLSRQHGIEVAVHAADLSLDDDRERLAAAHPDVDVLVNCAGVAPMGHLGEIPIEAWRAGWELKVYGYVHLTQLFLSAMSARGAGCIINIIGTAGRRPRADYICGSTGNASLIAFTEAVGGESPESGVRVLGINPGYTATERFMGRELADGDLDPEELKRDFPGMRVQLPDTVADVVAFMASERARGLSGVVIDCDRGQLRFGPTKPVSPKPRAEGLEPSSVNADRFPPDRRTRS